MLNTRIHSRQWVNEASTVFTKKKIGKIDQVFKTFVPIKTFPDVYTADDVYIQCKFYLENIGPLYQ